MRVVPSSLPCFAAALLLALLPLPRANALLNFDGNRNQIFVFGTAAFGYNSNIFADSTQRGDTDITGEAGAEYDRRAGLIGVTAIGKVMFEQYARYDDESALNPYFSLELTKTEGRATGSVEAKVYRESRSDSAVNLRTNSWNVPLALKVRYPFSERFYATSETGYLRRTFSDNNPLLRDYRDLSEAVDAFYIYTSKLDFIGGYRVRFSNVTAGPDTYDHWFSAGVIGSLVSKVDGTIRAGYEIRDIDGGESFSHFNVTAALNWTVTRKLTLSGQLSRDFNTIATGASVDTLLAALRANYAFTRKFDVDAGIGYGRNDFLGTVPYRQDDFCTADVSARYRLNEHFRLAVSYSYLRNWSTLSFSDFDRNGYSFAITARY